MNIENNLYLLLIRISSDGDFYWNSKTYERQRDEFGDLQDELYIYLNNPNKKQIKDIFYCLADEFKSSFDTSREHLERVRDEICKELKDENNIDKTLRCGGIYECYGNQEFGVELIPYKYKEIKIENTNEKVKIGSFDVNFRNLLI